MTNEQRDELIKQLCKTLLTVCGELVCKRCAGFGDTGEDECPDCHGNSRSLGEAWRELNYLTTEASLRGPG